MKGRSIFSERFNGNDNTNNTYWLSINFSARVGIHTWRGEGVRQRRRDRYRDIERHIDI